MPTKTFIKSTLKWIFILFSLSLCLIIIAYFFISDLKQELPDIQQLHNVEYQTPLSIYSYDKLLLAQFGEKKRIPIHIKEVPQQLINAFLAAEDDRFYSHPGVDYRGLIRATFQLLWTGKKKQGGSTITMQVTRNFLLTREKTYIRKIKEIILSLQIEREYSKDQILELYLNKIYLGHRSYGVAAAASTYYDKTLRDLNLAQLAMIAGLPKAPSSYNPISNPERALQRRNYVLRRMLKLGYIDQAEFDIAFNSPVTATLHSNQLDAPAPYIAEMVRQEIVEQYGEKAFSLGLKVFTTINSTMQATATHAIQSALHNYDQRHGYRFLPHANKISTELKTSDFTTIADTQSAHIVEINDDIATASLADKSLIEIPFEQIKWARTFKSQNYMGPKLKSINDVLKVNDLVRVRQLKDSRWSLAQIPNTEAAFVALNSNDGAILALSGGFDFFHNKYNRVIQSKRQPGSGFKPIIYTTALENGFTAASLINDAPVVIDDPSQINAWRPENYSKKFFGMTPLRTALRKSRNLISIRLLRELGIKKVTDTALRFGFKQEQLPKGLSLALGSGYASPLQMATFFSVFANGGFLIEPYFIDRIEDNKGKVLFQATPKIACPSCEDSSIGDVHYASRIISPQINFLMNSLLRDVVQRGTATKAKVLGRTDLAGKTGTTNEQRDAWFNGFSSGIAASAWLGFDTSKPLGRNETGGKAALPIWIDFMKTALKDKPEQSLVIPAGIEKVYIDPKTGKLAQTDSHGIWEYFRNENSPSEYSYLDVNAEELEETDEDSLF
ncbi:MAG: penicillin-binding protein 1A [Methylococcales symbiont of Hymedesmia sp. n. MRB-2018]|nr:MAG: penicillin-binding protein 1A [Methylococcales symbiont of Hymedesmia sp. n. MRB-2018]